MAAEVGSRDREQSLEMKIDDLTAQVSFLTEEALAARQRRSRWEEPVADVGPITNQAMEMATTEFDKLSTEVSVEDLVRLLRQFLSSVGTLEKSLVQLNAMAELAADVAPITTEAMELATSKLIELDDKGYFRLVSAGTEIADKVVGSFTEDDLHQLGDNVVFILQTVKEMTQPEVMGMLQGTAFAIQETQHEIDEGRDATPSLFGLAKQMRDPEVRRGMDRALGILRTLSNGTNGANPDADHK